MSADLRIFLISRMLSSRYQISVHRNFSTVFEKLDDFERSGDAPASIIHVGTDRPETDEIDVLLSNLTNSLLVTQSALLALPIGYAIKATPFGDIPESDAHLNIAVFRLSLKDDFNDPNESSTATAYRTDFRNGAEFIIDLLSTADDEKYHAKCSGIPHDLQDRLDDLRTSYLRPQFSPSGAESNSVFHFLKDFGSRFLETSVESLDVRVRTANALKAHGVKQIGDLLQYDLGTVLTWKNFGRKSLQDLIDALIKFRREWSDAAVSAAPQEQGKFKFLVSVCEELERIDKRTMNIVQKRKGWFGKVETLEEIGSELGVTRERIRQIEKKGIERLCSQLSGTAQVLEEIGRLLAERKEPLFIDLLELESRIFEGASNYVWFVGNIISDLSQGKYSVWELDGRAILSNISHVKWLQLNTDLRKSLEEKVNTSFTRDDLTILVESFLSKSGATELTGKLVESASVLANFALTPNGKSVLISFGTAVPAWVDVVLHQAESPLHFTEIWERCQSLAGRSMDVRRVHGAVADSDAWYFSRGIYGLSHHSHLSLDEIEELIREGENILLQNEHRQWHVREILEELMNTRPDLSEGIDKFILNNVLKASSLLKYLGRSIWVSVENDRKRIDISAALETLLEEAGRPIPFTELESKLQSRRGLSGFALCSPTARLARVSPSTWGLIDRDFLISDDDQSLLRDDLYRILEIYEKALHYTQLRRELHSIGNNPPADLTDYMIASIAQGDNRFRVYSGRLLGLSVWGSSRCLSIEEGLRIALQTLSLPATLDDIRSSVEKILERSVNSQSVYGLLLQNGLVFDEDARAWVSSGQAFEDETDDMDFHIFEEESL